MIRIASFDIGLKNFATWIDEYDVDDIPSSDLEFSHDGRASSESQRIIDEFLSRGSTVSMSNCDISNGSATVTSEVLANLTIFLAQHPHLHTCDFFVVEKQMSFGKASNPKALRLSHHVQSTLLNMHGVTARVVDFPAYKKTQMLGAPKKKAASGKFKAVSYAERKKWAIDKCIEVLLMRGEVDVLDDVLNMKKRDDVSDCLLQAGAFLLANRHDVKKQFLM